MILKLEFCDAGTILPGYRKPVANWKIYRLKHIVSLASTRLGRMSDNLDDNLKTAGLACICWLVRWDGRQNVDTLVDQGDPMNLQSHIDALKGRHATLESKIAEEDRRPRPDDTAMARMKVEKLRLKEEMERLTTR